MDPKNANNRKRTQMTQTLPIENYQDLVDTASESLMQISQQCKLMVVLMDATGIQCP